MYTSTKINYATRTGLVKQSYVKVAIQIPRFIDTFAKNARDARDAHTQFNRSNRQNVGSTRVRRFVKSLIYLRLFTRDWRGQHTFHEDAISCTSFRGSVDRTSSSTISIDREAVNPDCVVNFRPTDYLRYAPSYGMSTEAEDAISWVFHGAVMLVTQINVERNVIQRHQRRERTSMEILVKLIRLNFWNLIITNN